MANSKQYAVLQYSDFRRMYLRQEGARVYQFSAANDDSVIFDFSYAYLWGETLAVTYHGMDTLVTTVTHERGAAFDVPASIWEMFTYATNRSWYRNTQLADGFGVIEIDAAGEPNIYLGSATIDGREYSAISTGVKETTRIAKGYSLSQNYPNPFNPTTTIRYELPERSFVSLEIFNLLGDRMRDIVEAEQGSGIHSVSFDGSELSGGTYFYRITAGRFRKTGKMVLLK